MHCPSFIERFLEMLPEQDTETYQTIPRITGMLETAALEAELNDYPFFHVTDRLSRALHCEAPPLAGVRGALIGLGYKVARSHCKPVSIKTNAPHSVVWDVMKKWVDSLPKKGEGLKPGMAGFKIMEDRKDKDLSRIVLDQKLGRDTELSAGAIRYQLNPTANWGPMGRAKTKNHQPNSHVSKKPRFN